MFFPIPGNIFRLMLWNVAMLFKWVSVGKYVKEFI